MSVPLRLLIVEDNATDAELAVHQLRRAGFAPVYNRVETKHEYLAHLDSTLDLILADYSLPDFDALSALELLQERQLDIPFIIFSGSIVEDTAVSALKRGADDYLLKDRLARLGPAVEQALERKKQRHEKQLAEQALRASEERFRALIEHSWDGLLMLTPAAEVIYASPSTQRILGHAHDEFSTRSVFALIHTEELPHVRQQFQSLLTQSGATVNMEFRYEHKDGSWRWLECSVTNLLNTPGVRAVVVNYRDVTERKLTDAALHRSETMSLLGALVSGVAHEVRNPLFGISTTLDAFEARFGHKEEFESYLGVLRGQVDRLSDLMKDLLDYGRPISPELAAGSISEVIMRSIQACQSLAKQAGVEIVNRVNPDLPLIRMDRKRLPQVFLNLLENAIQHLPSAGQVEVTAVALNDEGKDWVECAIKDTGPGFQPEDLPRLFEPFFTRRRGGTGLGLSIVQRLVEAHDGKISISNHSEGGALAESGAPAESGALAEGGALVTIRFPVVAPRASEESWTPHAEAVKH